MTFDWWLMNKLLLSDHDSIYRLSIDFVSDIGKHAIDAVGCVAADSNRNESPPFCELLLRYALDCLLDAHVESFSGVGSIRRKYSSWSICDHGNLDFVSAFKVLFELLDCPWAFNVDFFPFCEFYNIKMLYFLGRLLLGRT